ncbi:RNA methyltransferase [Occallatibacter savannae]|uniref:RNA methyltransferase n=1 Tax=Occallatibacter savannae TaxID=1002691 RepID=UPI0013A563C2|nr:RNA methyltransferase [Occallatibacter savannae]
MLTQAQRDRISIVLVSPRNPLNIGAVARAMANFGFVDLAVVSAYEPHWREARSAVGAPELLAKARETSTLAEAVRDCTLVLGTGTLTHRKPEQPVVCLDEIAQLVTRELDQPSSRISIIFGPEKHGLTREDLSWCHHLVEIPTDAGQPSMNLGQAAAVCLYEIAIRSGDATENPYTPSPAAASRATSGNLDVLTGLIQQVMLASNYSPGNMRAANEHDLRLMLRRLNLNPADQRRALGLFRRILRQLEDRRNS